MIMSLVMTVPADWLFAALSSDTDACWAILVMVTGIVIISWFGIMINKSSDKYVYAGLKDEGFDVSEICDDREEDNESDIIDFDDDI